MSGESPRSGNADPAGVEAEVDLTALWQEFTGALAEIDRAAEHVASVEVTLFAKPHSERLGQRRTDLAAADRAHQAAAAKLSSLMHRILQAEAHTLTGFAIKAAAVKTWGEPQWWSQNGVDVGKRLAAQVLDALIDQAMPRRCNRPNTTKARHGRTGLANLHKFSGRNICSWEYVRRAEEFHDTATRMEG